MSTLTVYPDSGTGGTTTVGVPRRNADEIWATKIAGAGTAVQTPLAQGQIMAISTNGTLNHFQILRRLIMTFDTSALTSAAVITSAVLSVWGTDKTDDLSITPNIDVYTASPASNGTIVAADFDQVGSTSQTGTPITYGSWSTTGYNDFTLNATGISNISKTGITKFSLRNANYDVAGVQPTWSNTLTSFLSASGSDDIPAHSPRLVITYTLSNSNMMLVL